jgi:hypothetical protein
VTVRHGYNCPLLYATRASLVEAARALGERVELDVADATAREPTGAAIAGRPLVHGLVPVAALTAALRSS